MAGVESKNKGQMACAQGLETSAGNVRKKDTGNESVESQESGGAGQEAASWALCPCMALMARLGASVCRWAVPAVQEGATACPVTALGPFLRAAAGAVTLWLGTARRGSILLLLKAKKHLGGEWCSRMILGQQGGRLLRCLLWGKLGLLMSAET